MLHVRWESCLVSSHDAILLGLCEQTPSLGSRLSTAGGWIRKTRDSRSSSGSNIQVHTHGRCLKKRWSVIMSQRDGVLKVVSSSLGSEDQVYYE